MRRGIARVASTARMRSVPQPSISARIPSARPSGAAGRAQRSLRRKRSAACAVRPARDREEEARPALADDLRGLEQRGPRREPARGRPREDRGHERRDVDAERVREPRRRERRREPARRSREAMRDGAADRPRQRLRRREQAPARSTRRSPGSGVKRMITSGTKRSATRFAPRPNAPAVRGARARARLLSALARLGLEREREADEPDAGSRRGDRSAASTPRRRRR